MTTLGIAIVLATILFLIDRNHVWPQVWRGVKRTGKVTARVCLLLIAGGVVTYVIFYTWGEVKDAREKREQAAVRQAEEAQEKAAEAKVSQAKAERRAQLASIEQNVCGDKHIAVYNSPTIGDFPEHAEIACITKDADAGVTYSDGLPLSESSCAALREAIPAFTCKKAAPVAGPWLDYRPPGASPRRVRALYEVTLYTTEMGSLKCGQVSTNEIVTLLEDTQFTGKVKVRTTSGTVGWADQSSFEVVKR
jgi:hypothetical protein